MNQEDLLLAIVAEAQEDREAIQGLKVAVQALIGQNDKQLEKLPRVVREVLSAVPGELRKGVTEGSGDILREVMRPTVGEAKELANSLKTAAAEAQASAKFLRRTGIMQGFFLVAAAVLIIGLVHFVAVPVLSRGYAADLADIKAQVEAEKATLAAMQSDTWGLSLVTFEDGTRVIVLPKGFKYSHNGEMKDEKGKKSGRVGIVISP